METSVNNSTEQKKKKKKNKTGEALSDVGLKILALCIAVISWFLLSITQFPDINKKVSKIPVDFNMTGTAAESKGLQALNYSDVTVDVEIQGMNYEIGTYDQNDLVATINLDPVTKAGTYQLEIDVKSAHPSDNVKVLSVTPARVEVKFEQMSSVRMKVVDSSPNVAADEGYTLGAPEVSPNIVTIEGPENELEKIAKVEAEYSGTEKLSEDMTVTTSTFKFYDSSGELLDGSDFKLSDDQVTIKYVVYKKVAAEVELKFTDQPPGFDIDSIPYTLSHDTLQIASPLLDAGEEEIITLDAISLYEIQRGHTLIRDIPLSAGESEMSNIKQIEIKFDLDDYAEKTFTIGAYKIEFQNVPKGKQAKLDTESLYNVTMIGPKSIIEGLSLNDLRVVADISDITADGSFNHEITVYSDKYHNIWNNGSHVGSITVGEMTAVTPVSSSTSSGRS
ncbi:MAG: hypothetical protein K6B74_05325 [Ruminococcus sp.]|nr:hypothetical protein [Ruminococcus sp.]